MARRSVGKLGGDVNDEQLDALLTAAVAAPNHHETEPWRFTVLRGAARERIGRRWSEIVSAAIDAGDPGRELRIDGEARKLLRAPAIVVASVRTDADPIVAEEDFAATAAAVQNMLLVALELGLATIWRTGAMARSEPLKLELQLDASDRIVGLIYIGTPQADPKPRGRRSYRQSTRFLD